MTGFLAVATPMSHSTGCDARDACASSDLIHRPQALLYWWLPALLVGIGGGVPSVRSALWIIAFALAGTGCALNARRCGRTHCHASAPLFFAAALWVALAASGIVALHPTALIGTVLVLFAGTFLLEIPLGRYAGARHAAAERANRR